MQLILTALIVSFGSISHVQSSEQMGKKLVTNDAQDGNKIQQNFHHFFDSIKKNDMRKTRTYRDLLEQEAEEEQRAFHTMKEDLRFARQKSVRKQKNTYPTDGGNTGQKMHFSKRETSNSNGRPASIAESASRKLPDTSDEFEDLRKNSKVYIDKTKYITKLLKRENRFVCICRPRHFGKSNFLQMMKSFFLANQTLFKGLDIYASHDWRPHPVIYLDFNTLDVRAVADFKNDLAALLIRIGESYGYTMSDTTSPASILDELMYELSDHGQKPESVVVLVDEYDWPVRRNADADNKVEVWEMSNFLREFFQELRNYSDKIKLMITTCTTPLKLRDFKGGHDYLKDITYDPEFSEMIGLTETELHTNFETQIKNMVRQPNETFDSIVQDLRRRYNGYCFSKKTNSSACRLYNFRSVISALRNQNITNYWHATVDQKYNMIKLYLKEEYRRQVDPLNFFTNCTISRKDLPTRLDLDNPISMIVCMVIYGYLTLSEYKEETDEFILNFPNEEVREKFITEVLEPVPLGTLPVNEALDECKALRRTMFGSKKCEPFIENLNRMAFFTKDSNETTNVERKVEVEGEEENEATEADHPDRIIRIFQICDIKSHYLFAVFRRDFSLACTIDLIAGIANSNEQYVFQFGPIEQGMKKLLGFVKMPEFLKTFNQRKIYLMGINFDEVGGTIREWIRVTYDLGRYSDLQSSDSKYKKMYAHITSSKYTTTESIGAFNMFI